MKAFIFDFDGVIVDSERVWQETGDVLFFPSLIPQWTPEDSKQVTGLSTRATHALLSEKYGITLGLEEYMQKERAFVDEHLVERIQPLPGLIGLLERLKELQMPIGIGSSANRRWIEKMLTKIQLEQHFPVICSADDVGERTKPAPDIYLLVAEKLHVPPAECLVLEDTFYGIAAAKAAGMTCIAIQSESGREDQDVSAADTIVTHYDELTTEILESL